MEKETGIAQAIVNVMSEVEWLWKWLTVWSGNNSYSGVSAAETYDKIRKSMISNWLSILQWPITPTVKIDRWQEETKYWVKTKQSVFTDVITSYTLLHTSWEKMELWWYGQWVDTQDKGAGKATTYALKNTLINTFLIPTWDMYDTDETHSDDLDVPQVHDKPILTKHQFKEIAKQMNEAWLETARLFITESVMPEFTVPSYINDKIKDLSDVYKENQNVSDEDIDRIWKQFKK